ncbi:DUF2169 family type VI secretion system accessory protein [Pantoea agglomerans]|uniref:DUF2169 family type VI secretion system accessory protein n=1 Tax=Enterobacter agglomerans TaxID=549 RepID=UPI00301BFE00
MKDFINHTFFPALRFESIDLKGELFYTVSTHVSYDLLLIDNQKKTEVSLSKTKNDFFYIDNLFSAPQEKFVKFESDLAPFKPALDVVINGIAYPPTPCPVQHFNAAVSINGKLVEIKVTGPRHWEKTLFGWALSSPEYIKELEISYDKAFGGHHEIDEEYHYSSFNPFGCGWYPEAYLKKFRGRHLPAHQIEFVDQTINSISEEQIPAGYGFFGKGWRGRLEYAGTWDDKWKHEKQPGLPDDFSFRYWCGAHPRLINKLPTIGKITEIKLFNFRSVENQSESEIAISIPYELIFIANNYIGGVTETKDCILDTIVIDLPSNKVHVTYRIIFPKVNSLTSTELFFLNESESNFFLQKSIELANTVNNSNYILLPPSIRKKLTRKNHG